jgi:hypothetical protein
MAEIEKQIVGGANPIKDKPQTNNKTKLNTYKKTPLDREKKTNSGESSKSSTIFKTRNS